MELHPNKKTECNSDPQQEDGVQLRPTPRCNGVKAMMQTIFSELSLEESQRWLHALFDHTDRFLGVLTSDGMVLHVNRAFLEWMGARAEGVMGRLIWDAPCWGSAIEFQQQLQTSIEQVATGESNGFTTRPTLEGGNRDIELSLTPVKDESTRVVLLVLEGHDITQRLETEEALRQLHVEMNERVSALTAELRQRTDQVTHHSVELELPEGEYRTLVGNVPALFSYVDHQQRYRYVNHRYEELFQEPAEQIVGKSIEELLGPQSYATVRPHIEAVLAGNEVNYEVELTLRDGLHVMHATHVPRLCQDGSVRGFFTLVNDVTEWKRAEQQVKLLAEAISHLGEGVLITDDHLDWPGPQILFVNEAMCRITGYSAEELIGQTPRILHGEGTDHNTLDRLKRELSQNRSCLVEVINYRKDRTPYNAELFITPIFTRGGQRTNFVSIHRDITARKQAEADVRRLSRVFQEAADPILIEDIDGRVIEINDEVVRVYGWTREELIGQPMKWLIPPECHAQADALVQCCKQKEEVRNVECLRMTKARRVHSVLLTLTLLTDEQNKVIGIATLMKDISDLKKAERALRESEERLLAVLNTAADAIITIDTRGIIQTVNPATERLFGYTLEELLGQNVKMLMPPPHYDEHDSYIASYLESGEAHIIGMGREVHARRKDGTTFPVDLAVSEVDHLGLFTGVIRDITERKKLQEQLLEIAASEQRRIAHALHDDVGQELTGLALTVDTLITLLQRQARPETGLARQLLQNLHRTTQKVRALSQGLNPVEVDPEGLMAALTKLAERVADLHSIHCTFTCNEPVYFTQATTATHLYHIVQEAINNAIKHGQAQHIQISLEQDRQSITLQVVDDGTGIDLTRSNHSEGLGLRIMRYRADLIHGKCTIERHPTGGTLVRCVLNREDSLDIEQTDAI